MLDLYKNIKIKREQLGISQEKLAKLTGYTSRSSIAKIEKGQVDLSQTKIELFAKALRTSPSELLGWTDKITDSDEDAIYQYQFEDTIGCYVQEVGEFLYHNPNHKKVIDAAMRVPEEDVDLAKTMLDKISGYSGNT